MQISVKYALIPHFKHPASINERLDLVLRMYGECLIIDKVLCINGCVSDAFKGAWEERKIVCKREADRKCVCVCMRTRACLCVCVCVGACV